METKTVSVGKDGNYYYFFFGESLYPQCKCCKDFCKRITKRTTHITINGYDYRIKVLW